MSIFSQTSKIGELEKEVFNLRLKEATFEERFARISDKLDQQEKVSDNLLESINKLQGWSIGWRNTVIICLITLLLQLILIPLEKQFHLFGLS